MNDPSVDGRWAGLIRCGCCGSTLAVGGACPLCEIADLTSPPHICLARGALIGDEDGCQPAWPPIEEDDETAR